MSDLVLRLARPGEDARIADFINQNFDMRLPLINRADFYQFYYAHTPGAAPQFALAEQDGEILCAAGYILANQSETPDVWVSVWVAAKGHNGVGLELMDALSGLLNARVVACNNIRANTCVLYHFLGWQAERLPHYYRLGAPDTKGWQLAVPGSNSAPLPVQDDLPLTRVPDAAALAALLNRNLTFVAPVDLSSRLLAELCSQIDPELVPVISAAAAILQDSAQPHVFLGGEQHLLDWPQLEGRVGDILTLLNDEEQAAHIIAPPAERSESVLLGEDLEPQIPGLCIVSDRYLVGGGLWGTVALIGPTRMPFQKLMPLLHLFADELGEGMSGKRKDTPQMAAPRRTVIYKEDLE